MERCILKVGAELLEDRRSHKLLLLLEKRFLLLLLLDAWLLGLQVETLPPLRVLMLAVEWLELIGKGSSGVPIAESVFSIDDCW